MSRKPDRWMIQQAPYTVKQFGFKLRRAAMTDDRFSPAASTPDRVVRFVSKYGRTLPPKYG
jgi:hypothetical protein